jgi:hypothetical protein
LGGSTSCFYWTIVGMFIRQTRTRNQATGEGYVTYRLVRSERIGGKVRQITVLNLGRHFPIKAEDWPMLRIATIVASKAPPAPCPASDSGVQAGMRPAREGNGHGLHVFGVCDTAKTVWGFSATLGYLRRQGFP